MTYHDLLKIIHRECQAHGGFADGEEIKRQYGKKYDVEFRILVQRGYIAKSAPIGSISLSPSGWRAATLSQASISANE